MTLREQAALTVYAALIGSEPTEITANTARLAVEAADLLVAALGGPSTAKAPTNSPKAEPDDSRPMPFGKHKGRTLNDLARNERPYLLAWALENCDKINDDLRESIEQALGGCPPL